MTSINTFTPSQLISSDKWYAVFGNGDEVTRVPLICWALGSEHEIDNGVVVKSKTTIHGMLSDENGEIISAKLLPDFISYDFDIGNYEIEAETLN